MNHPNICTVHGLEEHDGRCFLVMEYVDGKSLREALDGQPLPAQRIVHIAIQAGEALASTHARGMIHRDLKPANLMLTREGRIKLTDFSIAESAPDRKLPPAPPRDS